MLRAHRRLFTNHALCQQTGKGFLVCNKPHILQDTCIEPRIKQVQNSMLHPPDILIDRHPIINGLFVKHALMIVGTAVSFEIPGRFDESVHGICFTTRFMIATLRTFRTGKWFQSRERRPPTLQKVRIFRQDNRKIRLCYRHNTADLAMHHGNRGAPISLSGNTPIPKPVANGSFPNLVDF